MHLYEKAILIKPFDLESIRGWRGPCSDIATCDSNKEVAPVNMTTMPVFTGIAAINMTTTPVFSRNCDSKIAIYASIQMAFDSNIATRANKTMVHASNETFPVILT